MHKICVEQKEKFNAESERVIRIHFISGNFLEFLAAIEINSGLLKVWFSNGDMANSFMYSYSISHFLSLLFNDEIVFDDEEKTPIRIVKNNVEYITVKNLRKRYLE